jgi:hypothetical protein
MNIIAWIQAHWVDVTTVISYVIAIATIIVKLTPTLKDDTVLQKIVAFLGKYIALNKTIDPADRPK